MVEYEQVTSNDYHKIVTKMLKTRKEIDRTFHNGWDVTCYRGPRPSLQEPSVMSIEYSAYAVTDDLNKSEAPNLSVERVIRVDFDETSVVSLTGETKEEVTEKLQAIFQQFSWDV